MHGTPLTVSDNGTATLKTRDTHMHAGRFRVRSVFVIDGRHAGRIPREMENALDLMEWSPLRPGVAYVLDWETAIDAGFPVWDRIELVLRTARRIGLAHRLLTMRNGEKIPLRAM